MPTQEQVVEQIQKCFDPEIPVNVYDLGLVYNVAVHGPIVEIRMTFTSESCPSARDIPMDIRSKVGELEDVNEVNISVVWDPPWHPRMISPAAREELGIDEDSLEG